MTILYVTPTWPLPPTTGARVRVLTLLAALRRLGFRVVLLFVDINVGAPAGDLGELPVDEVVFQPFGSGNRLHRLLRWAIGVARRFGPDWLYQKAALRRSGRRFSGTVPPNRYHDPAVWARMRELVREHQVSAVWFTYALWGTYPLEELGVPTLVDTQDVLSDRLRIALESGVEPRGAYATPQEEAAWLPRFDQVIAIQPRDAERMRAAGARSVHTVGHTVTVRRAPRPARRFTVGFIGGINPVNRATLAFIEAEVLPALARAQRAALEWYVAGAVAHDAASADRRSLRVEHSEDFFAAIDVLLNPVLSGTGLKIKNVEALGFGVPVITTPIGAEGLEECADALLVRETAAQMAAEIVRMMEDPTLHERLGRAACEFAAAYNRRQDDALVAVLDTLGERPGGARRRTPPLAAAR